MRAIHRVAIVLCVLTFGLIVWGGHVNTTRSGMAFPDWPTSNIGVAVGEGQVLGAWPPFARRHRWYGDDTPARIEHPCNPSFTTSAPQHWLVGRRSVWNGCHGNPWT